MLMPLRFFQKLVQAALTAAERLPAALELMQVVLPLVKVAHFGAPSQPWVGRSPLGQFAPRGVDTNLLQPSLCMSITV